MPLKQPPQFKSPQDRFLELPQPAIGGLNLKDLEFEQEVNQSPYMLNVMYSNGSFGKRYGQEVYKEFENELVSLAQYNGNIIVHSGTKIYKDGVDIGVEVKNVKGMFTNFNRFLYYLQPPTINSVAATTTSSAITLNEVDKAKYEKKYTTSRKFKYNGFHWKNDNTQVDLSLIGITYTGNPNKDDEINVTIDKDDGCFWEYNGITWKEVEPYVPDLAINMKPDGSVKDIIEPQNMVGSGFKNTYNGDGSSKDYILTSKGDELDDKKPRIWFNDETDENLQDESSYSFNKADGKITFNTAPPTGVNNVIIEAYYSSDITNQDKDKILKSKYSVAFGGTNNSSLFVAGGGDSSYYYSEVFDATYFPVQNYASVGNSEDDITGFGLQYNVLVIFKPKEIYQLSYYVLTENNTSTDDVGLGAYESQIVNGTIGCDAPNTIQVINNKLTWFNSTYGVCTLVSTNIQNERNVIPISRNIDTSNGMGVKGILDFKEDLNAIISVDYDNKYFLVFGDTGMCYVWDYRISGFASSSQRETNPKDLDWFLFDNFYVKQFLLIGRDLLYSSVHERYTNKLIKLNNSFVDLDFDGDGHLDPIRSYYMTPFFQFDAVEYLKTVKNVYVQCRGDTSSVIDVYYYTDESITPEKENESIRIGGRIWSKFTWDSFQWLSVNHAKTFRRKCSLKKIEMCAFYFENNEVNRDMSISHIGLQYQIIKTIK